MRSVAPTTVATCRCCCCCCCSTVQYNDLSNRTLSFSAQSAPPEHQKKVTLLLYFAEYMYTHLSAGGGNIGLQQAPPPHVDAAAAARDAPPVFMKKWFRTDRAIVMYLSNGTLQVCPYMLKRFFTFLKRFLFFRKNVGKVQRGKQINKKHFQNNSNEMDL